jgi:hypothetical protein
MKSLLGKLGVILIGLAIFGNTDVWGADWKPYGASDDVLCYYDTESITRPSKNIVRVWVKWDYTEKGVLREIEKSGKQYENLNHSINLWEINCSERKFDLPKLTYYDNKGDLIESLSPPPNSPQKWIFIIPESIGELLYKEVCK